MGRTKKSSVKNATPKRNMLEESAIKKGFKNVQDMLTFYWVWYSRKDLRIMCKEFIRKSSGTTAKELSKKIHQIALGGAIQTDDIKKMFASTDWLTITAKIREQMAIGD